MSMSPDELFEALEALDCEPRSAIGRMMDNEPFYLKYLIQMPDNENYIEYVKKLKEGDCKTAERAIHSLKGMALNLGLLPISDHAVDIINDLRSGSIENARVKTPSFEKVYFKICDVIKEYIKQN